MTNGHPEKINMLQILQGHSSHADADTAVRQLAEQINCKDNRLTLVFFSDGYDESRLKDSLKRHLQEPVIGCSSTGQITSTGYQLGGISATSLNGSGLTAIPYLITPLSSLSEQIGRIAADVHDTLDRHQCRAFGLLLVDGLSAREEVLTATLYRFLGDIPIIGGSAGDMLKFEQTSVYYQGQLLQDAAVFTLCLTTLPFTTFKHQHFQPTSTRLVVTEADTEKRLVREINGEPAVEAYARLINTPVDQLTPSVFSQHPLMLRVRNDYYVRSIAGVEPDGSLKFYCAINAGLVLTLGKGGSMIECFEDELSNVKDKIGEPSVIIGCDCILRRLSLESTGLDVQFGKILADNRVIGFSTYGEQFNSLHVNQTFTGVAIGG